MGLRRRPIRAESVIRRARLTAPTRCAGCGERFANVQAFNLHATGQADARPGSPRHCRSPAEMHALGMRRIGAARAWYLTKANGG